MMARARHKPQHTTAPRPKKLLLLAALLIAAAHGCAQRVSHTFSNVSLSDALITLSKAGSKYEISFIYDELEDFTVSADIRNKTIPQAIQELIGFYPIRATLNAKNEIFVECTQKSASRLIGRLLDTQGKPVPYATIMLATPHDTAYITSGVSNTNGRFVIPCNHSDVLVRVSCIGYKTLYRRLNVGQIGTLHMSEETQNLSNITVRGRHPLLTRSENKTIFHASEMLSTEGMTANDMLRYLPRVIVRADGTILYSGTLATLYVNERRLDADEATAYLQSLSAKDIERIELQDTRSAENETKAQGGIISIITKRKLGLDGTVRMAGQEMQGSDFALHPATSAYFGTTRWNIYGAYDYRRAQTHNKTQIDYVDIMQNEKHFANSPEEKLNEHDHNYKLGATALLDKEGRKMIGAEVNGTHLNLQEKSNAELYCTTKSLPTTQGTSAERNLTSSNFMNAAASYKQLLDPRESYFRVLANYNYKHAKIDNVLITSYPQRHTLNIYEYNGALSNTNNFALSFDMRKNYDRQGSLRWGAAYELSRRKHMHDRQYEDENTSKDQIHEIYKEFVKGTSIITEPQAEWHWKVNEDIASAYGGFSRQWNDKLFLYSSLRLEYSVVAGTDPQFKIHRYKHRRFDPIPYLYISCKTDQRLTYSFTYSRQLIRPTFNQQEQYRIRRNDFIVDSGNTALDCQTTDMLKLAADKGPHSIAATYSYSADAIIEDQVQQNGLAYRMSTNNSIVNQWSIDYAYTNRPASWWQASWYVQAIYTWLPHSTNRKKLASALVSANNDFSAGTWGNFSIELFAAAPTIYGNAYAKGTWKADCSYRKNFLKETLTLKISAQDIFNSLRTDVNVKKDELYYQFVQRTSTRTVVATLTWNFRNKQKVRNNEIDNPNETKKRL